MARTDTWMPLYVADYIADTQRLSLAEHGAYLLLLMEYWRHGPLPDDDKELAAIVHADRKLWDREIGPSIRRFFHRQGDGFLHQKRIDLERSKALQLSNKRREAVSQRRDRSPSTSDQTGNKEPTIVDQLNTHAGVAPQSQSQEDPDLRSDAFASPEPELAIPEAPNPKPKPKADPSDPKTILWREGKTIVDRLEIKSSKGPGGLLGMFVDDAKAADGSVDYALVLDVVREAEKQRPEQPLPWIRAAIRARVSPGGLFGSPVPIDPDDPGGVNAWCAANGVAPATSPGDMKVAKWIVGGVRFDKMATDILLAAGMAFDRRLDWSILRDWIEAGIDGEAIYQTIKRMVASLRARGDYNPPGSLKFFDNAVRAAAGRTAA